MNDSLDALYRDIIMDHFKYPRGTAKLTDPDIGNEGKNPTCGDEIQVAVKLDGEMVEDIFVGCKGCAISVASASMLSEIIKGKSVPEVKHIASIIKAMLKGEELKEQIDLGDLEALRGVKNFPVRIKCALLAWTTLIEGLEAYENRRRASVITTE